MKRSSGAGGFTIVETLIVLAVTGSMLTMAMVMIGGRQNKAQFEQGVRSFQQDLQQTISDVGTGYYNNNDDVKCTPSPVTGFQLSVGAQSRGTNETCIFLGKAVQFAVAGTNPEQFNVYTIAALRKTATGNVLDLTQGRPAVVDLPNRFDSKTMPFDMKIVNASYGNNPANRISAIAYVSSLSSLDSTDKNQQINVIAIPVVPPGTMLGMTKAAGVTAINAGLNTAAVTTNLGGTLNPANGVQICVRSGSTNQSALYNIGGDGGQTTVSVTVKNSVDCS